jgi:hypothetical protein
MLPSVSAPEWNLTVPSTGEVVKFRPFLTKEYKILLHAVEMKDPGVFVNAIGNIIEACTKLKIDSLTMYDVDYIFLHIRSKSVGEVVPIRYICNNVVDKKKLTGENEETVSGQCGTKINVDLNLQNVKVVIPKNHTEKRVIRVNETTGIKLKAPSFKHFRELIIQGNKNMANKDFNISEFENDLIFNCIDVIFEGEKLYVPKIDFTIEEFDLFLEHLPASAITHLNDFFEDLPYVAVQTEVKCPVCGNTQMVEVRTLEDFFV